MVFAGKDNKLSIPFDLLLAQNKIPDMRAVFIAAYSDIISSTERQIWNGTSAREFKPTTGMITNVISDSADDNIFTGGIGAQILLVEGLDENFNEIFEVVFLNGINEIVLENKFIKINICVVVQSGSSNVNQGIISIYSDGDIANLLSLIIIGDGVSKTSSYMVPAGHNLYIKRVIDGTQKNTDADLKLVIAQPNNSEINFNIALYQNTVDLDTGYFAINAQERFFMTATQQSGMATVSSLVHGVLVKN